MALCEAKNDREAMHPGVRGSDGRSCTLDNTLLRWGQVLAENPGHTLTVVVQMTRL